MGHGKVDPRRGLGEAWVMVNEEQSLQTCLCPRIINKELEMGVDD